MSAKHALTAREMAILIGFANGETAQEIGRRLHVSKYVVNKDEVAARRLLGAKTRAQAIAIMCLSGRITAKSVVLP